MSRRKSSVKRPILADARYDSQTVSKFINAMMLQGKKSTAERIFSLMKLRVSLVVVPCESIC